MKTTIFSLTMIFVLYNNCQFASNTSFTKEKNTITKSEVCLIPPKVIILQLAPTTPSEATFEDVDKIGVPEISSDQVKKLAPVTPDEASFEDDFPGYSLAADVLSPLTPKEATFED